MLSNILDNKQKNKHADLLIFCLQYKNSVTHYKKT